MKTTISVKINRVEDGKPAEQLFSLEIESSGDTAALVKDVVKAVREA